VSRSVRKGWKRDAGVAKQERVPKFDAAGSHYAYRTGAAVGFWQAIKQSYRGSFAFLLACPLLALVPVAFELVQHMVEVHIGLYDSVEAAKALDGSPIRLAFGFLKTIGIMVPGYWVVRWLATCDERFAATFNPEAVRLFSFYLLVNVGLVAIQLFLLPRTGIASLIAFLAGEAIGVLFAAWAVGAALGNPRIGPVQSAALMARHFVWNFVFFVVAMLPLMAVHYAFAALAILGPKLLLWPALVVDSLLVAWLTALLIAISYFAARRSADLEGVALTPGRHTVAVNELRRGGPGIS